MKLLLFSMAVLIAIPCRAAVSVRAGTNISNYPNISSPSTNARYVLELPGVTNYNISHQQLKLNFTQGLATVSYVNSTTVSATNGLAHTNFVKSQDTIVSNGVISQLLILSNNMPANLWTNSAGFVRLTTNGPVSIASTGLLGGLVVTQDVRFLGHNSASNSVWVCTNTATGEGEWRTVSIVASGIGLALDPNTNLFNLQYEPVRGSTWYAGTNGIPTTNEARAGLEHSPFWRSLRMGEVAGGADFLGVVGNGSNYWNNTNIGPCTVGFGSNAFVKGAFSSVLGGAYNHIMTGSVYCVIAGGSDNYIRTNIASSSILGGTKNRIDSSGFGMGLTGNSVIAGGTNNAITGISRGAFIGAGENNQTAGSNSVIVGGKDNIIADTNSAGNVISGGDSHVVGGLNPASASYAVIAGGFNHQIDESCDFSAISGGRDNLIGNACTNGTIAGGAFNNLGLNGGTRFGSILGGERNTVDNFHNFAIGTSNKVGPNGSFSGAIGVGVTNDASQTLVLGYGSLIGKVRVRAATNATVGGLVMSTTTPVASAGAAETNLITRTIPAHTLTNSQDRLTFRFSGRFAATANAKQLKVVYGSETILDTTSQIVNSGSWTIEGEIIRTGDTSQSVNAEYHGNGELLYTTAASLDLAQTNGIATVLKMTSTAAGDGDTTNRTATVWLWPAP